MNLPIPPIMAFLGWPEIVAILVVVLIFFGAKKLPELAKGLGQGIKEFKKATSDVQDDFRRELYKPVEEPHHHPVETAKLPDAAKPQESAPAAQEIQPPIQPKS